MIVSAMIGLAASLPLASPTPEELRQTAFKHVLSRHGASADLICQSVGKIVSVKRLKNAQFSVRYNEAEYYSDPTTPLRNNIRMVVERNKDEWIWVSGDEPACKDVAI